MLDTSQLHTSMAYFSSNYFVLADISSGDPDVLHNTMYGVLCVFLGYNAWNERTALVKGQESAKDREQDGQ